MSNPTLSAKSKLVALEQAMDGIEDGMTVMLGGWGACAAPDRLIAALARRGLQDLTVIITGSGPAEPLIETGGVRRMITSFGSYAGRVGAASAFERCARAGSLEVELCSQGVLAERMRAGGAGIPAFYVDERAVGQFRSTGETRSFNGVNCVLETALRADVALIGASVADPAGNLSWSDGERNFNEVMAFAADLVIVEAFEIYDVGWLAPEQVMVPGLVVHRVVGPDLSTEDSDAPDAIDAGAPAKG